MITWSTTLSHESEMHLGEELMKEYKKKLALKRIRMMFAAKAGGKSCKCVNLRTGAGYSVTISR